MNPELSQLADARRLVAEARAIVALTGAGISAESGVPTFRGPGGLWRDFRAEDLATPEAFERDPKLVWEWYDWRRRKIAPAKPNLAHYALVTLEKRAPEFTLISQNVDGLHAAAGSRRLLEIHGTIWRTRCVSCGETRENRDVPMAELPPHCRPSSAPAGGRSYEGPSVARAQGPSGGGCGALLRPDVVWFGEPLPYDLLKRAFRAIEECDLMIVVGTSAVVQPAASMGQMALEHGARLVEVNTEPTALSDQATPFLRGKAGEILPKLVN